MILLSMEEIMALHEKLTDKTGGSHGIRDRGLLESAVYSAENALSSNAPSPESGPDGGRKRKRKTRSPLREGVFRLD